MPPVLVLGCVAALAVTTSPTSAATRNGSPGRAHRFSEAGRPGEDAPAQARERADAGDRDRRPICTLRIVRAEPSIDRGMVVAIERPVDPGMVVPSQCGAE